MPQDPRLSDFNATYGIKPVTKEELMMTGNGVGAYEPKAPLYNATVLGLQGLGIGAFWSALQNALGTHSAGASGFFTRTGGTMGFYGAIGATYALVDAIAANTRETHDPWNGAMGACAAGFLVGIRRRSVPIAVGSCALLGATIGVYDYTAGVQGRDALEKPMSKEEKRKAFFKQPPPSILPESQSEASAQV